jgi:hypothetical protein
MVSINRFLYVSVGADGLEVNLRSGAPLESLLARATGAERIGVSARAERSPAVSLTQEQQSRF